MSVIVVSADLRPLLGPARNQGPRPDPAFCSVRRQ